MKDLTKDLKDLKEDLKDNLEEFIRITEEINEKSKILKDKKNKSIEYLERIKERMTERKIDKIQLKGGSLRIKTERKLSVINRKLCELFLDKQIVDKLYKDREVKENILLKYEQYRE